MMIHGLVTARGLSLLAWMLLAVSACGHDSTGSADEATGIEDGRAEVADVDPEVALPPLDEPVDVLAFARLRVSGIRFLDGLPWPREQRDGAGAMRDGREDTGWKVPVDEPAWVEIDLAPVFGAAIALHELSLNVEGGALSVQVELFDGCGGDALTSLAWETPATPLSLSTTRAACLRLAFTSAAPLTVVGLGLTSRDARAAVPDPVARAALEATADRIADAGVVEGFYGVPWSWRERRHMLAHLARLGLSSYVYAPKHDPMHRDAWRTVYPPEDLTRFTELLKHAETLGVNFYFGISPLIDYDWSDPGDYEILLGKLTQLLEQGARGACLLADDIEFGLDDEIDGELGARHAALANQLLADLRGISPEARLWFVPTVYSDARLASWPGGLDYLRALRALDPDVPVLWTGTDTFSETLEAADLTAVTEALSRPPLIWDNFWANDGGDGFVGRILLAPFSGRSQDLAGAMGGMVQNPSIQGALTRLVLTSFGDWYAELGVTPAADALARAAAAEATFFVGDPGRAAASRESLVFLMQIFEARTTDIPRFAALTDAVERLVADLDGDGLPTDAVAPLLALVARMAAFDSELHHSVLDADLIDDVRYPAEKVRLQGEIGVWALTALGERFAGRDGAEAMEAAEQAAALSTLNRFNLQPDLKGALLKIVAASQADDRGFEAPAVADTQPACVVGVPWRWRPFESGAAAGVHGLPGASVAQGEVSWSPPHAGQYSAIFTATSASGWAHERVRVLCSPRE